jgi:hypothetical protein
MTTHVKLWRIRQPLFRRASNASAPEGASPDAPRRRIDIHGASGDAPSGIHLLIFAGGA